MHGEHAAEAWVVQLDRLASDQPTSELLHPAERRRAVRFANDRLARRYTARRAALRTLLGAALGLPPQAVPLTTDALGKPRLAGSTELRFSVSHCGGTALIALAEGCDVGVDIESAADVHDPQRRAARLFDVGEARTIASLPPPAAAAAFVRCWTVKEAVLKALGRGLTQPLESVVVEADPTVPPRLRRLPAPLRAEDWTVHELRVPADHLQAAIALSAAHAPGVAVRCFNSRASAR